jgi:hypothetical protein
MKTTLEIPDPIFRRAKSLKRDPDFEWLRNDEPEFCGGQLRISCEKAALPRGSNGARNLAGKTKKARKPRLSHYSGQARVPGRLTSKGSPHWKQMK